MLECIDKYPVPSAERLKVHILERKHTKTFVNDE